MSFDPDKFLAEIDPPKDSFDPDAFLAEIDPPEERDNLGQALLEGAGQGLSFGYLSQLQAKAEPLTDRLFNLFSKDDEQVEPAPWSQLTENGQEYLEARDQNNQRHSKLAQSNPRSYIGSQIAGGVATGATAAPVKILSGLSKVKQAATLGGAYGVLSNPKDVEGVVDEIQVGPRLKNALIGTLTGYGAQVGLDKVAKYSKPLASKLANAAERYAAKAMGAERGTIKELGDETIKKVGRYALDEDIIKPSLFKNTEKMINRNNRAREAGGNLMESAYSVIDDSGIKEFNPLEVAAAVDDEIGGFYRSPINKGETNQLENTLESILMRGDDNISLKDAQMLKQELGKVAKWKNNVNITDKEMMARDAYKVVSKSIDEAVESGAEKLNNADLAKKLNKGKELYGMSKSAEKLLTNRQAREQGNRYIGLTDGVWGGASLSAFGPKGLALIGAKKVVDKYGSQVTARFLDRVAKNVSKLSGVTNLPDKNPPAFQALVFKLAVRAEERGGGNIVMPGKAAENDIQIKGQDKFISRGMEKLVSHEQNIDFGNPKVIKRLLFTKKGEIYLSQMSSLKPGSKAAMNLAKRIEQHVQGE